jgi:hypothetical protein
MSNEIDDRDTRNQRSVTRRKKSWRRRIVLYRPVKSDVHDPLYYIARLFDPGVDLDIYDQTKSSRIEYKKCPKISIVSGEEQFAVDHCTLKCTRNWCKVCNVNKRTIKHVDIRPDFPLT